jgi:transcriptional regulator with XRE-family HTH domain
LNIVAEDRKREETMSIRKELVEARKRKGWSQEDLAEKVGVHRNAVSEWERGVKAPYPVHVQRLCDLFGMTPEELGLMQNDTTNDIMVSGKCVGNIVEQCAAGVEVCRRLSYEQISSENIRSAQCMLTTYIPILQAVSIGHTAPLLAQIYQIRRGNAYHLEGLSATLKYGEEAVHYARIADDVTILTTTLHELASVYEWPLPGIPLRQRHRKSLDLAEELIHIQETRSGVPHHIQAWNYIGYAKFQALNGLKQDTYTAIGKANDAQSHAIEANSEEPITYHVYSPVEPVNLVRQAAIAYSYLGDQPKAVSTFLQTIAINGDQAEPTMPISNRMYTSLLSEALYSTLHLPMPKKDKDLSVILWKASLSKALELRSITYFSDAERNLHTMQGIWPDDAEIADLRDLLVPWE